MLDARVKSIKYKEFVMKKDRFKKELKIFGIAILLAILSAIPRMYVSKEMFSNDQLNLITFVVCLVMVLCNVNSEFGFVRIIIAELINVFIFTLILSVILSWTFLQLLVLFLFVYFIVKMFQVINNIS